MAKEYKELAGPVREKPLGGGIYWHEKEHALECAGCLSLIEVRRVIYCDPELLATIRQLLELDHEDCWRYASAEAANNARIHRKDRDRLKKLAPRGLYLSK
jgi:hypothetical protein